ncbi:superoxide dismutase (Cu-Zn) [Campylobacter blaseri]|uniref:Superoxide dismutase n=1 Tax=Campylobacter blaseri TaxID=2042961 RepID=A0A2P8QZ29_9BACT|nr:superoxide dismutase family protein [Campylobacter blaseri]PSM51510.1 superoxide dismutase [Campylobacter blaseri]PSM52959.1 superoxide dismutase [Campylobacter blaseri]QKF86476.1 superoxide dismutase (Cu-Zn) [Campylobacter blaseri]
MKKIITLSVLVCGMLFAQESQFDPKTEDNHLVIQMDQLSQDGNKNVGEVVAIETKYGVAFFPNLKGVESGIHGFHVHENGDCGATEKGLGMKAGGHWDPENAKKHSFPWDDSGHKGDLPALFADAEGVANYPVLAPKIKTLNELKGHSLMIHVGGDNHHDHPKPLGGGGPRMICGVIK